VPWDLLQQAGSADHLSRVVSDTSKLGIGLTALMGRAVRDTLMGGVFLTWAVLIDWRLTLLFMVGIIPIGICIRKLGKRVRKASKAALQQYARMVGSLQESMQAADVVRVHNAEGYERRRFSRVNRRVYGEEMKARTARALSSPVVELIAMACVMAVATVAAWYVFRTPGGEPARMLGVLAALGAAGASLRPLANLHNELQAGSAAAGRLMELLALPTERDQVDADHGVMLPRHERAVSFDAVTYHYPDAIEPALDAVTLDVQQGQTIAIVGPNGAGKSTLVSLLPRLIEPASGRVLIDGHDVGEATLRSVRQQMAVVTQRSVLFAGTIAQNIAYGRRHANRDQVEQAAKAAFADDFIARLPGGYDTLLGDGGTGLSGGQKQRLCIARAVLRDPAILILDEATSQIDAESEARIAEALRRLRRGRTTFVIAHRLSTVVDADRIVVMEAGRIVDQGRHDELVQRCDLYRTLAGSQLAPAAA
jgi:ABC-type multidrug transport system fused ATPase/permease subunit